MFTTVFPFSSRPRHLHLRFDMHIYAVKLSRLYPIVKGKKEKIRKTPAFTEPRASVEKENNLHKSAIYRFG